MNRDQRRLLAFHGETTVFQSLLVRLDLLVSASSRTRYNRIAAVSAVLRGALGDPDDRVVVKTPAKPSRLEVWKWVLLAGLVVVAVFEFRGYTIPTVGAWVRTVMHRCGF